MSDRPRILIFEPEAIRHQIEYVRHILSCLVRTIDNVSIILLTTSYVAGHPDCLRLLEHFGHLFATRIVPVVNRNRFFGGLRNGCERQWREAERLHRGLEEIGIEMRISSCLSYLSPLGYYTRYSDGSCFVVGRGRQSPLGSVFTTENAG